MKLNKIGFARLIGFLERVHALNLKQDDIELIDEIIDIEASAVPNINTEQLHVLMALMQEGTRKIDAIKQHRMMTGYGLKESKDAVEKYWPDTTLRRTKQELYAKLNEEKLEEAEDSKIANFINRCF